MRHLQPTASLQLRLSLSCPVSKGHRWIVLRVMESFCWKRPTLKGSVYQALRLKFSLEDTGHPSFLPAGAGRPGLEQPPGAGWGVHHGLQTIPDACRVRKPGMRSQMDSPSYACCGQSHHHITAQELMRKRQKKRLTVLSGFNCHVFAQQLWAGVAHSLLFFVCLFP